MRRQLAALVMVLAFGGLAWAADGIDCFSQAGIAPDLVIRACTNIIARNGAYIRGSIAAPDAFELGDRRAIVGLVATAYLD